MIFGQPEIVRLNPVFLNALALDVCRYEVFTSDHVLPLDRDLLEAIFLPLGMPSAQKLITEGSATMIFEYFHRAKLPTVKQYPCFSSCRMISAADHLALLKEIERLRAGPSVFRKAR